MWTAFWALFVTSSPLSLLADPFEGNKISQTLWQVSIGKGESFAKLERRDGGKCLHLFGDHSTTSIRTKQAVPNFAYTLEFDFFQPLKECGGYQAVVHHPRPEGHSYCCLLYTSPSPRDRG